MLEFHLKMLEDYLDQFKIYFDGFRDKLRKESDDNPLKHDNVQMEEVLDVKSMEVYENYFMVIPKLHYSSFLVTWYSLLESELKTICGLCKEALNLEEYKKNKGRSEIKSIERYLIGANLYLDMEKWHEVDTIRKVRNKVVHLGPDYDKKLNEYSALVLKKYIDEHNLMPEGKYKSLFIHYYYCQYLLNFTSSFFFGLYSELDLIISMHSKVTKDNDRLL